MFLDLVVDNILLNKLHNILFYIGISDGFKCTSNIL